jgi:mRNA interferase RelE/StbE
MYSIRFARSAACELEKIARIDRKLYLRLIACIESLKINPYQGKRLKGRFRGDFSLRVGGYRIIYTVDKGCLVVIIIDLGHRREVYR